jgi:hypothetical protein
MGMRAAKEMRVGANKMTRFLRTEGKITETLGIPVDEKLMKVIREAKARKFEFNRWAREVLYSRIQEVTDACGIEDEEAKRA